jgi:hypothetical protein
MLDAAAEWLIELADSMDDVYEFSRHRGMLRAAKEMEGRALVHNLTDPLPIARSVPAHVHGPAGQAQG